MKIDPLIPVDDLGVPVADAVIAVAEKSLSERIRLGHAYWSSSATPAVDDVLDVMKILSGEEVLGARVPEKAASVARAELILCGGVHVIYAFSGCLHPKLGTIGLVISPAWLEGSLRGVSRCDTGGLAGQHGAFSVVPHDEVEKALVDLSFNSTDPSWRSAFHDELTSSYANSMSYVSGDIPNHDKWSDVRRQCIDMCAVSSSGKPDRRLWTWEMRFVNPPELNYFEGLVVSPEALKQLEYHRSTGRDIPSSIRVLHGAVSPAGVHYFESGAVASLLNGEHVT